MQLGIDRLLKDKALLSQLKGKRVALVAHPASVTSNVVPTIDALIQTGDVKITAAFGPQHGMRGDKQDNMIETDDYFDPVYGFPVFSLYGQTRRPTAEMMNTFDVVLVDLQDVGCRIYTFVTTLLYMLEEAARLKKTVWILDRPNPAGRPIEGLYLRSGWESFVGAGPMMMRHGLTLGEIGKWFVAHFKLDVDLQVIAMQGYEPGQGPGYGWPLNQLTWINPSPNAANLSMARAFCGTVLVEGTEFSEGRGTTRPLEVVGAPDIDAEKIRTRMYARAADWLEGAILRTCYFEPTFHKHVGKMCHGLQFHVDGDFYKHEKFRPFRMMALFFKVVRELYPDYRIWRKFPYEYEHERLAIDLLSGSPLLREWVDDTSATIEDFNQLCLKDEAKWKEERRPVLLYSEN